MSLASKELTEKGQALLDAAYDYWLAAHKEGMNGAIIWLDDSAGRTLLFTRGEYRPQLLSNVDTLRRDVTLFTQNINNADTIDRGKDIAYGGEEEAQEKTEGDANVHVSGNLKIKLHPAGGFIAEHPGLPARWLRPDGTIVEIL